MVYRLMPGNTKLFVRFDLIEPGDVLLTRGADSRSLAIAISTVGPYSHAALWLPLESPGIPDLIPDRIVMFRAESAGSGVGPTDSHLLRATLKSGADIIVSPLDGVQTAELLRHPEMKSLGLERLLTATKSLQESEFYLAYSLLGRLAAWRCIQIMPRSTVETRAAALALFTQWKPDGKQ
jgi:hypothetical protein